MELYRKINEGRQFVKDGKHTRQGRNDYSSYDYWTPDQVTAIAIEVCEKMEMIYIFDLLEDEYGLKGILSLHDINSAECQKMQMRTAKPSIKATNDTQQMGGCYTYTKRYLLMELLALTDEEDLDSTPKGKGKTAKKPSLKEGSNMWQWAEKKLADGSTTIDKIQESYTLTENQKLLLTVKK